jgi:tetratricopeptide (TPR) repeat protein
LRYLLIILLSVCATFSYSQDLISVANTFLNDKDYAQAKSSINEALNQPDLQLDPRAWYTKARVYHEIFKNTEEELKQVESNYVAQINAIVDAYEKTRSLTERTNNLYILATNQLEILWADGINNGVSDYQKGEFDKAINSFLIAKAAKPADTLAYLYSGLSAQNAGMYQKAIDNYSSLSNFTKLSKDAYNGMIVSSQAMNSTYEEQLEYVEEALVDYPNHIPYIIQEVRLLLKLNRFLEAESILQTASQRIPNNPLLIIREADLYDRIFKASYIAGEPERSEEYFKKASNKYETYLNSFPNDFAANYNYSVMINEQANRVYVRINLMSKEEYEIRGKETEKIGHQWTKEALPYMEKAHEIKMADDKVVLALKVYYERLQMSEKLQALNERY